MAQKLVIQARHPIERKETVYNKINKDKKQI